MGEKECLCARAVLVAEHHLRSYSPEDLVVRSLQGVDEACGTRAVFATKEWVDDPIYYDMAEGELF